MAESKSKTEPAQEPEVKRDSREPRALSTEYHKARKQLMLWAAVLFVWELVGIDLEKAKDAGGNTGAIIGALKSPQAVPWALLILVGYFLFKITVEWYQCNFHRRLMRVARIDFLSAWVVALLAYTLYVYQAVSRVQFADLLQQSNRAASLSAGAFFGVVLGFFAMRTWNGLARGLGFERADYLIVFGILVPLAAAMLAGFYSKYLNWLFSVIGIAVPTLLLLGVNAVVLIAERRSLRATRQQSGVTR